MAVFPELGITALETAQAGKEVTINEGLEAASQGAAGLEIAIADGDNALTLEESRASLLILTGALTAAAMVIIDDATAKRTTVYNRTTGGETVEVKIGSGGTPVAIAEDAGIEIFPGGSQELATGGGGGGGGGSIATGAYGSLPAAGTDGNVYLPNDAGILLRDNGTIWEAWGPIYPMTVPAAADFATWVNQGSATLTQNGPQLELKFPAGANSGDNLRGVFRALPSAPYTITALILPHPSGDSYARFGIAIRDSASGRINSIYWDIADNSSNDNPIITTARWSSPTAFSATIAANLMVGNKFKYHRMQSSQWWFRIRDDNTDLYFEASADKQRWIQIGKEARTAYLAAANQCGFFIEKFNGSLEEVAILKSWKQG
jgi:hypothetical protein